MNNITLIRAGTCALAGVLVSTAGCGSDSPPQRAANTIPVSVVTHDGAGLAVWLPSDLRAAARGSDAVVVAKVDGVLGSTQLQGVADTADEVPPPLPVIRLRLNVQQRVVAQPWAAEVPSVVDLFVLDPSQASPDEELGLRAGGTYVFFLRERNQAIDGVARPYGLAWDGGFTEISSSSLGRSKPGKPGTDLGALDPSTVVRAISVERFASGRPATESPNPIIASRDEARRKFNFDPRNAK